MVREEMGILFARLDIVPSPTNGACCPQVTDLVQFIISKIARTHVVGAIFFTLPQHVLLMPDRLSSKYIREGS